MAGYTEVLLQWLRGKVLKDGVKAQGLDMVLMLETEGKNIIGSDGQFLSQTISAMKPKDNRGDLQRQIKDGPITAHEELGPQSQFKTAIFLRI